MLTDLVAALAAMPLWAQVFLGLFALAFVVMAVGPSREYRRYRALLEGLATDLGATAARGRDKWPVSFATAVDGRAFTVSYDYRRSGRGGSYRRPGGHLLITSTPLAGNRWALHQVDIIQVSANRLLRALEAKMGAGSSDERFRVVNDGVPVREGWFDADTRAAVNAFYDTTVARGPLGVKEQRLLHIVSAPWGGIDGPALRMLLQRQAAVATAFERTAGWRGPTA